MDKDTLESLESLQSRPDNLPSNIIEEIMEGDDGENYEEEVKDCVVGGGELWKNSLEDFDYELIKIFDDNLPIDFYGPIHMFYSYSRYNLEKIINNIKEQ